MSLTLSQTLQNFTHINYQLPHEGDAWPSIEDRLLKSGKPELETSSKKIYSTRYVLFISSPNLPPTNNKPFFPPSSLLTKSINPPLIPPTDSGTTAPALSSTTKSAASSPMASRPANSSSERTTLTSHPSCPPTRRWNRFRIPSYTRLSSATRKNKACSPMRRISLAGKLDDFFSAASSFLSLSSII